MPQKTEIELQRAEIADTVRTLVRMKHRQLANRELNTVLYDTLGEFDTALQSGELRYVPAEDIIDGLLGAGNANQT